jgi:SNF2-related domain/SNF2 Helicase protein/Helicase conserved C-terminal domain
VASADTMPVPVPAPGTLVLAADPRVEVGAQSRHAGRFGHPRAPEGPEPVSFDGVLDGELIFVPDEVPRHGRFARWGLGVGDAKVELVFTRGTYGLRKRLVAADLIPLAEALPAMITADPGRPMRRSARVWAAAAAAGLGLVARGRLLPAVGPDGTDIWRAGPLDPADLSWLRELAAVFPPDAHALAVPGSRPMRLRSPEALVRDLWDAIADTIARSPSATRATASPAFAASTTTQVTDLADWLADSTEGLSAGARLGLRIEAVPPAPVPGPLVEETDIPDMALAEDKSEVKGEAEVAGEPGFRLVLQLRSTADPSLIVDAAALWSQPETVLTRFGRRAEEDLLLALRRGSAIWPPLAQVLTQATPNAIGLHDDDLTTLLGGAAEELNGAGIEVLWPSSMLGDGLKLRAAITPAPGKVIDDAGFGLDALLEFRWQLTLDGALLDADEVAALAEAKRPLIRLRGRWVILDPALLDKLRRPPRTRMRAAEALGAVLAGEAEIDGETVTVHAEGPLADLAERLRRIGASPEPVETPRELAATLRPYQRRGLSWMAAMCEAGLGGCLADDMGLGKTIQLIALHLHRRDAKHGPTLVVCPASLLGTWEREVRKFAPSIPVRRYHGGERHLADVAVDEIVLVTYGVLLRDSAKLAGMGWGLVVADEAQHVKNPLARTARELRAVPAPAKIALTGTPVENRLSELWSILDWTTPGLLGHLETFTRRVAMPVERYRDPDATARFAALVRPFMLRRKKTDPGIAPELPRKTETSQYVPLTTEQVTLYEAMVRETMEAIENAEGIERAGLVFKLLTALKQICNHPAQYLKQSGPLPGRSGKLAAFDELTEAILASGESMLVFTQYTQMGTLLQEHLDARGVRSLFLHGGLPVRRREEMVAAFQQGEVPVFLLSLKAGGTGLTLTRATHVLHYDRWWNPAVEDQATDRAYRIGQDRPVQVHRLIAEGTLEDRIAALLEKKRELAEAVVGSGERWIAELSDAELADLVSLRAAA